MKIPENVYNWLLEENNPPVRYLTMTKLFNQSEHCPEVQQARSLLMNYEVTQGILNNSDKFWQENDRAYWKYTGKYWQVIFLGQFLADGNDPRIAEGVNDLLVHRKWIMASGGQCLTANLLSAFIRLGFGDHPVVIKETESLAKRIIEEKGVLCGEMGYSLLSHCYMAIPKILHLFALIPSVKKGNTVKKATDLLVQEMLENEVFIYVSSRKREWQKILENAPKRADLQKGKTVKDWIADQKKVFLEKHGKGERTPKPGWLKFGFPLHYNSDIVEAMYALALLHVPMTKSLEKPIEVIRSKMTSDGTWILENSLNGRMWADVEEKGKPSKWITYFAIYVLNHFER